MATMCCCYWRIPHRALLSTANPCRQPERRKRLVRQGLPARDRSCAERRASFAAGADLKESERERACVVLCMFASSHVILPLVPFKSSSSSSTGALHGLDCLNLATTTTTTTLYTAHRVRVFAAEKTENRTTTEVSEKAATCTTIEEAARIPSASGA